MKCDHINRLITLINYNIKRVALYFKSEWLENLYLLVNVNQSPFPSKLLSVRIECFAKVLLFTFLLSDDVVFKIGNT